MTQSPTLIIDTILFWFRTLFCLLQIFSLCFQSSWFISSFVRWFSTFVESARTEGESLICVFVDRLSKTFHHSLAEDFLAQNYQK